MNTYQLGDAARLPGTAVRVTLLPDRIPPRTKKRAQEMLRTGFFKYGWSSKARQLANKISEMYRAPMFVSRTRSYSHYMTIDASRLHPAEREHVIKLVRGAVAAAQLDDDLASYWRDRFRWDLSNATNHLRSGYPKAFVPVPVYSFQDELTSFLKSTVTPQEQALRETAAARLDDPTPIILVDEE